jgi:hypothetical protein
MMIKISVIYNELSIDTNAYEIVLKRYINDQMKLAAVKFAEAALQRIPVRTGFVAGAFSILTDLLGSAAKFNPIVSHTRSQLATKFRKSINSKFGVGEYYYPGGGVRILKTPQSGKQFATQPGQIFTQNGATSTFRFNVDITYFQINENVSGYAPTAPWGAFVAGKDAFVKYLRDVAIPGLPKISDFIKRRRVSK